MDETRQNIKKSLLQLIVYFYLGLYDYSVLVTPFPMCVYSLPSINDMVGAFYMLDICMSPAVGW